MKEITKLIKNIIELIVYVLFAPVIVALMWISLFMITINLNIFGVYVLMLIGMVVTTGISSIVIKPAKNLFSLYKDTKTQKKLLNDIETGVVDFNIDDEELVEKLKSPYIPKEERKKQINDRRVVEEFETKMESSEHDTK